MLEAIHSARVPFRGHLKQCEECRTLYVLLREFREPDRPHLTAPPAETLQRWVVVPLLEDNRRPAGRIHGRLAFDSWQVRELAGMRDMPNGLVRRLCLRAKSVVLELVGERQAGCWDFTARVYQRNRVSADYVLKVGRRRLLPDNQGFYLWSQPRAPKTVSLLAPHAQIEFDAVKW